MDIAIGFLIFTTAYLVWSRSRASRDGAGQVVGGPVQAAFRRPFSVDTASWAAAYAPEGVGGGSAGDPDDIDTVARTLWGEARGEGADGMRAVANVIMNRVADRRYPGAPAAVAQQAWQFSAWNRNDPNRERLLSVGPGDRLFRTALEIARQAVAGRLPDATGGATHYHADWIDAPFWAAGATVTTKIGRHIFYRGVA